MAYCRFIDSDVYIYDDINHGIICCACSLMEVKEVTNPIFGEFGRYFINKNFIAGYDYDKMLAHIAEHRAVNEFVPEDVDEQLVLQRDCIHEVYNKRDYCCACGTPKDAAKS